jgi:dCMP deaminase
MQLMWMTGKNKRISWDEYFMNIAEDVAKRSTCIRRQIGAVIVNTKKEIVATGYNGNPRGQKHCSEIGCIRDIENIPSGERSEVCTAVHAEQNALIQAGTRSRDGTMYCIILPCNTCAKMIANAGIKRVVYKDAYPEKMGLQLLEELGIEVVRIEK